MLKVFLDKVHKIGYNVIACIPSKSFFYFPRGFIIYNLISQEVLFFVKCGIRQYDCKRIKVYC